MKFSTILTYTTFLVSTTIAAPSLETRGGKHHKCCLCEKDVKEIVDRWFKLFHVDTIPAFKAQAEITVADDFVLYDETLTDNPIPQGVDNIAYHNKTDFIQGYSGSVVPQSLANPNFRAVKIFHSCDSITVRWEADQTVIGDNFFGIFPINHTMAPIGAKVQHKGVDMLAIDCPTKLVKTNWGSQDFLGFVAQLGIINFVPAVSG